MMFRKLARFIKSLFRPRRRNPHNLDNVRSARLYLQGYALL